MSKVIDQRVVEMRFDNSHFEKNTKQTMSTLDKLKAKLNLSGAAKGLDEINNSANKVNMKGLSGALDSVTSRFTALEVMGVTALANITNSAVNAGIRIAKALTIDPVTTGFSEYELKMDSIKTIMASTGESLETVNKYLEDLNKYSDQTIYRFSDMTQNIGKFTNNGVKLEDAVYAIKGISNQAALAGASTNQAAQAMYNLSQALSAGYVKLIDWKSVENAQMSTVTFKQQLLETAAALGTVKEASDGTFTTLEGNMVSSTKNFNETLQDQWLTSEVLIETLKEYADSTTEIGKKAFAAAQDVTKLSQVFDIAKEVAQSGWARTWEIIFGDLEKAKATFSRLSKFITNIQTAIMDYRNGILEKALGFNPFSSLLEKLDTSGITKMTDKVEGAIGTVERFQKVVSSVWRGDYNNRGDNPDRFDLLRNEGWNPSVVQVLVNKGSQYKITMEDIAKAHETCNVAMEDMTKTLDELTDAQLLEMGLTKEEIDLYRDLEKQSKKTGKSISELLAEIGDTSGRTLLMEGFANLGNSFASVLTSIGEAWTKIFPPESTAMNLYNLIKGFNDLTNVIKKYVLKNADELTRTLQGLFAILDIITTFVGGGFKIAFTVVKGVLGAFGFAVENVLDFTALLGDGLVILRDAIDEYLWFFDIFGVAANFITKALKAFKDWILSNKLVANSLSVLKGHISDFRENLKKLKEDPELINKAFDKLAKSMANFGKAIGSWFEGLIGSDVAQNIFDGLIDGLKTGGSTIYNFLIEIGTKMLEAIKNVLGIQSPSTEFYEIGKNSMEGLYNGISDFVKMVYNLVMSMGGKLIEIVKDLDLGSLFTIGIGGGALYAFLSIAKAIANLTSPLEEVGDFIRQFRKTVKSLGKALEFRLFAESMKAMATAVAILAGSVIALTLVDPAKLKTAVKAIGALMVMLGVLTFVASRFKGDGNFEFAKVTLAIVGLSIAMSIMAKALKTIGKLEDYQYEQAVRGFTGIIFLLMGLMSTIKNKGADLAGAGAAIAGIVLAIYLMGKVVKSLGKMDVTALGQGVLAVAAMELLILGLIKATTLLKDSVFGNVEHIGGAILKIAGAMLLMMLVVKMAAKMEVGDMIKGGLVMVAFGVFIVALMKATKHISDGENVGKIGGTIFGIASALLMMALVAKIAGSMDVGDMIKGVLVIGAFSLMIVGLLKATKHISDGENVTKIGRTLLSLSVAIGIMGVTAALLSLIDIGGLTKGLIAIGLMTAMMKSLIVATGKGQQMMGSLITMTVAIGVLALSLGLLSMIDATKLATATLAIGTVMGMFALVIAATGMSQKATVTLVAITACVVVLALVLRQLAQLPMEQSLGSALALSALILAMTAALGLLALIGPVAIAALTGLGALIVAIISVGAVVAAIGAVVELFPEIEGFLDKGIPILEKIGYAIGSFVGNIIGGLSAGITSGLPTIGKNLSGFMEELQGFIKGATAIGENSAVLDGVKKIAEAILIITGTNLLTSLTSWITGGSSITTFGPQLALLGEALKSFIGSLDGIDDSKLGSVKTAGEALKYLAEAAAAIPNEGGWAAKILGENSITSFSGMLPLLAKDLTVFVTKLGEFGTKERDKAKYAGKAIVALAEAASELPNDGGWAGKILGENSIASFGAQLPSLGTNMSSFITNLGTFTKKNVDTVGFAGDAIAALANASEHLPNDGGWAGKIFGENSLASFGSQLPEFGTNLAEFVTKLGSFSDKHVASVNSASALIWAIADLGMAGVKDTGKQLKSFGKNLTNFADKIKDFVDVIGEVGSDNISSAMLKVNNLINMTKMITSTNIESLGSFGKALKNVATDGVKGFVNALSGASPKSDVTNAIVALSNEIIKGAETKRDDISDKFESIAKSATNALASQDSKKNAIGAGVDLVLGFVAGINESAYMATDAGSALGKAALDAAKASLDENSPSKEAYKIGAFFGEGLSNGISEYSSKVYNTSYDVAEYAKNGLTKAIQSISNLITDDMVSQPTIRPVLDLSDIESGVGYMDSMFANGPSVGVMANLNGISSNVRSKLQNGPNGDVVTAIDRLRKDMGNVGTTNNYNVNGVTYGDGDAAVTQAIETLVRAALIERRV